MSHQKRNNVRATYIYQVQHILVYISINGKINKNKSKKRVLNLRY